MLQLILRANCSDEVRAVQVGAVENSGREIDTAAQIGAMEACRVEVGAPKVRVPQISEEKPRPGKIQPRQIGALEINVGKVTIDRERLATSPTRRLDAPDVIEKIVLPSAGRRKAHLHS